MGKDFSIRGSSHREEEGEKKELRNRESRKGN